MKTNLVLVSLLNDKTKEISEKIALDFELYYADIEEILNYNFFNANDIKENCGIEYLNKLKTKTIREISTYENTLICIPFSMFIEDDNAKFFNRYGTTVFLDYDEGIIKSYLKSNSQDENEVKVALLALSDRRKLCKESCNIRIKLGKNDFVKNYKKIKKVIDNYYL